MSARTAWGQMIARCYDPTHPKYHRYGGRGIRVCDRWICRRLFLDDMGERPIGKTLNRVDNDGDYSPENCAWSSYDEQNQNRADNRNIEFGGETKCLTEWAKIFGLNRTTVRRRLDYGWTVEKALKTPPSVNNHSLENTHENVRV